MIDRDDETVNGEIKVNGIECEEITNDKSKAKTDFNSKINDKKRKASDFLSESAKKRNKLRKDLYKPPTVEELNELRETENLFHSNLFRLQIEEVINAVKVRNKYKKLFEVWFDKFKSDLNSIIDTEVLELNNDEVFESCNIKIPMKKLNNDFIGNFKLLPPTNIMVGGSYAYETIIGPDASVDILVELPKLFFRKTDYKNYVYMRKKAMYLAYIGKTIDKELVQTMCFVGNHSNPILKIIPNGKLSKRFIIYIHLVAEETTFPLKKFTPEKNNVKSNWYFKNNAKDDVTNSPTPHYNSIILYDLTALKTNVESIKLIKEYPNIRDGIILLKIWLKQRGFSNSFETFNGHIITMYVLYLLNTKKLNTFMSSYQIVRNTWQYLGKADWCNSGISLSQDESSEKIKEYHKYYDCVFLDFTGFYNLASNLFHDTFQLIVHQAEMSLNCLNKTRINDFQVLFMRKMPFYRTFDQIICIHHEKALENIINANINDADEMNYGSNKYMQISKFVMKILKQGLGKRISLISFFPRQLKEWEMNQEIPNDIERVFIGFQLDPSFCFSIIEKGPGANLPEAEAFRKFWGDKSELRRFKDSSVCEAVVWVKEDATYAQKREVPQMIAKFILESKLKLFEKVHYFLVCNQMEQFLKPKKLKVADFSYGTEEAAQKAINAFDALEKDLSGLNDLPLTISGIQGCSPLFRYTDVFPPLARFTRINDPSIVAGKDHLLLAEDSSVVQEMPLYLSPIEVVVQMCASGKWPDDLEALRMTKAAFYIQISECLRKQYKLRAHGSMHYVDVVKDGLVFRLRIAVQKEIGLIKQQVDEDGVTKYRDNEESAKLEEKLFHLPKITGALFGLHRQQSSFGPACCLAKRWLSAQLIDDFHMPEIVVELIMASIYLDTEPENPVQQPQVAFLRFLEVFARENWSTDPIIVNFNEEMNREEIVEVENFFGTSQDSLPPLFISTPYDKQSSMWTRKSPSSLILYRISALAKEVFRILEIQLFKSTSVICDSLFVPRLSEYDCIIQLKDSMNPRRYEAVGVDAGLPVVELLPVKENYTIKIPIVGFNPVTEYLKELRSIYNDFALFFHDTYGGSVIGVLLKPQSYQEKDFKVPNTYCQMLNNDQKLILNTSAMIEDFYILGNGLVQTINIQSKRINTI